VFTKANTAVTGQMQHAVTAWQGDIGTWG